MKRSRKQHEIEDARHRLEGKWERQKWAPICKDELINEQHFNAKSKYSRYVHVQLISLWGIILHEHWYRALVSWLIFRGLECSIMILWARVFDRIYWGPLLQGVRGAVTSFDKLPRLVRCDTWNWGLDCVHLIIDIYNCRILRLDNWAQVFGT